MATQRPAFAVSLAEFAAGLLSEREVTPRARLIAHHVAEMLPGAAVVVYVVEDQEAPAWSAKAAEGEIQVAEPVVAFDAGTLGAIAEKKEAHVFLGSELKREPSPGGRGRPCRPNGTRNAPGHERDLRRSAALPR